MKTLSLLLSELHHKVNIRNINRVGVSPNNKTTKWSAVAKQNFAVRKSAVVAIRILLMPSVFLEFGYPRKYKRVLT